MLEDITKDPSVIFLTNVSGLGGARSKNPVSGRWCVAGLAKPNATAQRAALRDVCRLAQRLHYPWASSIVLSSGFGCVKLDERLSLRPQQLVALAEGAERFGVPIDFHYNRSA